MAGIVGTILLPPFGGLIAAPLGYSFIGALADEDFKKAWNALFGMAAGWGLSIFARVIIGFVMMVVWWLWVW